MALIGNYSVLSKNPGRSFGGGAIGLGMNRGDFNKSSPARAMYFNTACQPKSGIPDGYRPPYCWVLPIKAGALSARKNITGAGELTLGSLAGGVNGAAVIAGTGDLTGTAQLIISMAASIAGTGTISGAQLQAFLQLAAALSGSGTVSGALLSAIGHLNALLDGDGDATATIKALGTLAASINVTGDVLTSANVASAILDEPAGVETGLTVREALRLIAAATAGKISGAAGTTITIRNAIADGKDRIIATVDSDGNRTAITYDLTD